MTTKTKQERKDEFLKRYLEIERPAREKYLRECKKIDKETINKVCEVCGK